MSRWGRGFARGQRSQPSPATSRDELSTRPPESPSESSGTPAEQAEGAFQFQRRRGQNGRRGQPGQSYRGRGGRRGGSFVPGTEQHGSFIGNRRTEGGADSGIRGPEATAVETWRSDVPRQLDQASGWSSTKTSAKRDANVKNWDSRSDSRGRRGQGAGLFKASSSSLVAGGTIGAVPHSSASLEASKSSFIAQGSSGSKGRRLAVKANFFAIENFNKDTAFHYDLTFNPDKPKKLLRLVLEELKKIYFPDDIIAFDGVKNAYSVTPLAAGKYEEIEHKLKVLNEDKNRVTEFKVVLKLVARVDLSLVDQKCIQILEVVLRSAASLKYSSVGRSFFSFNNHPFPLMDGMVIRSGLHLSVKRGQEKLYVNFDSVHKAFFKAQPVVDTIVDIFGCLQQQPLQDSQIYQLRGMLKGVKVTYSIPPHSQSATRVYTVQDISKPPGNLRFKFKDLDITVEDYFKNEKHYSLKYRNLPCLKLGASAHVPAELCYIIEGQVIQKHLNPKQSERMIKQASIDPAERIRKINAELKYLDLEKSSHVKEFGIKVSPEFQVIDARVLDSPKLLYNNGLAIPQNGVWHPDSPFLQGAFLKKWSIVILDHCIDRDEADTLADHLIKEGKKSGLIVDKPYPYKSLNTRSYQIQSLFQKELANFQEFDLVIVVGYKNKSTYVNLKTVAELKIGVCTQYITNSVLRKRGNYENIIHNIVQKLNAKLGGVNHSLCKTVIPTKLSESSVMYVGADVAHPSLAEIGSPSVAAVCASHDVSGFKYSGQICIQPPKVEIIKDLERIMIHHLNVYEQNTGRKPEIILFFRDGVGEGQFAEVRAKELTAIQTACSKLGVDYKPKVTFLVVQKRHHARFFPTEQVSGRNKNVPPGTVVDNTVTNPKDREFYLVSHNSPRGVCRPCRYHCLWDDNNLSEDELQGISYYQCFTYSRCEQSVSYPVPTYYAHHAAARGKTYLMGENYRRSSNEIIDRHSDNLKKLPPMYFV